MSWLAVVAVLMGLQSRAEGLTTLGHTVSGSVLRDMLNTAGLMDTLNNDGPFTLFVPSDTYLTKYLSAHGISMATAKQDPALLKEYLLYHIVNGTISYKQLYNERMLTALNGENIRVNSYDGVRELTVQGVSLQGRSSRATNGLIHYLFGPMMPANGTVTDVIASQSDLSTLVTAAHASGVDEFLADQTPVTLFAPTNAAFSALGDKVNTLLANPQLLAEILKYHVVPGTLYSVAIHDNTLNTFEEADRLHLTHHFRGSELIEGAHLERQGVDMSATNGVVHKIDHVLIPESLKSQI